MWVSNVTDIGIDEMWWHRTANDFDWESGSLAAHGTASTAGNFSATIDTTASNLQELIDRVYGVSGWGEYGQNAEGWIPAESTNSGWSPVESTDDGWSPVESTDDYENPYFRQTRWWPIPDEVWKRNYEPKQEDGIADREAETPEEEKLKELFE